VYWPRSSGSAMGPAQLIPLAERTGLIGPLGEWAIRAACRQAALWHRNLPPGGTMAVNVGPSQLSDPHFVDLVADILRETGLPPGRLAMEIAAPSMSTDRGELVAVLNALREVGGRRLAVDGFGAGSSSLAVLRHLPLDWVKIDEALVRSVAVDSTDAVLMRLVIKSAYASACGYAHRAPTGTPNSNSSPRWAAMPSRATCSVDPSRSSCSTRGPILREGWSYPMRAGTGGRALSILSPSSATSAARSRGA